MTELERAVVLGTGGGAFTIAAELGLAGVEVTVADLPRFASRLEPVQAAGGITVTFRGHPEQGPLFAPIAATSDDPASAIAGVPLVIVSVPSFGHRPFADLLAPVLEDGQMLLWVGEGGGAFTTVAALRAIDRRPSVVLGETNSLPYGGAAVDGPAGANAMRKTGGTYIAGLPTSVTPEVSAVASRIWPWVEPAHSAWETVLLNFNAIDHVATMVTNLGRVEGRKDTMLLWGEGASPGVARVIGAVDDEYTAMRGALGLPTDKRYEDFLVAQGLVDRKRESLHATIHASLLTEARFECGPGALDHRFIAEDVPYSLVLASSIADEVGVAVPVIDGLISIASAAAGRDYRKEGRAISAWGLAGAGRDGLMQAVSDGWW